MFQSNEYDNDLQCLQDSQCVTVGDEGQQRCSERQTLLTCAGASSALFDGIVGRNIPGRRPEDTDLLRHYVWQQPITPNPYVAMAFDPPLVQVPNMTLYFYRDLGVPDIQVPIVSMCFSRLTNFTPCNTIALSERPSLSDGVVVWPMTLLTNVTVVRYLRIDMQYEDDHDNDYIFLSEIRVAERAQGISLAII